MSLNPVEESLKTGIHEKLPFMTDEVSWLVLGIIFIICVVVIIWKWRMKK